MTRSLPTAALAAALAFAAVAAMTPAAPALRALQPTPQPTQLPPPAPTPTLPVPPAPTAVPNAARACRFIRGRVPDAVVATALANPHSVGGWDQRRNVNMPESPLNPRQTYLSLRNVNVPYHFLYNPLVFRAGCP